MLLGKSYYKLKKLSKFTFMYINGTHKHNNLYFNCDKNLLWLASWLLSQVWAMRLSILKNDLMTRGVKECPGQETDRGIF